MPLVLLSPLFVALAVGVKLSSPGPVFYRQERISWNNRPFMMLKFRSMPVDVESQSGPKWASQGENRATRFGAFLRRTSLDELPQLFNVLAGSMSLVGPRPERPGFYRKLENEIPFFAERTYGVAPGITGLAQVNQGYDTCIEDVRSKVGYDHRYALALDNPLNWLRMDFGIMIRTVGIMITGRGQ